MLNQIKVTGQRFLVFCFVFYVEHFEVTVGSSTMSIAHSMRKG